MTRKTSRRLRWGAVALVGAGFLWYVLGSLAALRTPANDVIAAGRVLFNHEWRPNDPLAGEGDGLGPVFNGKSCVECHFQGGVGGAGPNKHNVLGFEVLPNRREPNLLASVVHAAAVSPKLQESREQVHLAFPVVKGGTRVINGCSVTFDDFDPVQFIEVSTPALFGAGLMDRVSEGAIRQRMRVRSLSSIAKELQLDFQSTPVGRPRILPDGRIGKFGWKGQFATLEEFVATACAVELGLTNPKRTQDEPRKYAAAGEAKLDLDQKQFDALVAFVHHLPQPTQILPADPAELSQAHRGQQLFNSVGCADCHPRSIGGIDGIYSDFLLHRIEDDESGPSYTRREPEVPLPSDHPLPDEWKTPPLWGVADSAPYFHDGRSPTLLSAILRHGGSARAVTQRFQDLSDADQQAVIAFLKTLRAPAGLAATPGLVAQRE